MDSGPRSMNSGPRSMGGAWIVVTRSMGSGH